MALSSRSDDVHGLAEARISAVVILVCMLRDELSFAREHIDQRDPAR